MKTRRLSIAYRLTVAAASLAATVAQFLLAKNVADALNLFSYFTIQSNLIVTAVLMIAVFRPSPRSDAMLRAATFWILITGIVFNALLSGVYRPTGLAAVISVVHHTATPLAMLANWIIFEEKGRTKIHDIGLWLAYPLVYLAGSLVRGLIDGFYPYWFINPTKPLPDGAGSWLGVGAAMAIIAAGVIVGSLVMMAGDRAMARVSAMLAGTARKRRGK